MAYELKCKLFAEYDHYFLHRGSISFQHVRLQYTPAGQAALDLNLHIEAGETLGVCGRTGAVFFKLGRVGLVVEGAAPLAAQWTECCAGRGGQVQHGSSAAEAR